MKRIFVLCAIAAAAVGVSAAQGAVVTNEKDVTFSISQFVPCANGGAGETISGDVQLHVLITSTMTGNHISGKAHFQPQGGTLVGETTGDVYRATGVTQATFSESLVNGQFSETFVNNFRLIGPGPGNNLIDHLVAHITINANGDTTVEFETGTVDCK
jgi:hypothetical protein